MKTFLKIVAAMFVAGILLAGGCAVLVGSAANSVSNSIKQDTAHANVSARHFRVKFAQVKVGNSLTGAGGMTVAQVKALLGKPDPGDTDRTVVGSDTLVTYTYHFFQATGAPFWTVDFTNGRVSDKSAD